MCSVWYELKLIKDQWASALVNSWGIKTPLSKIPLLVPLLFQDYQAR